ncbi:MAG: phosphoribosylformylglycinamidine synthase subunit PurQ [Candidatus Aenigmatarchaeota archaeon]
MAKPRVLVLTGHGVNCDEETAFAFKTEGGLPKLIHVNDLIEAPREFDDSQILAVPGGFTYGDDTGAGLALANKLRNNLWDELLGFIEHDKLVIGICNGFQVLTNLGIVPALDYEYGRNEVALTHNDQPRYCDRWVDLQFSGEGPWTCGLGRMMLPIAHGEGKFYTTTEVLDKIKQRRLVAARYVEGEICNWLDLEPNPNGSVDDIAGITNESGKVLGMMPHPERAIFFTQLPHWTYLKERSGTVPEEYDGRKIFRNGVRYFE